MYKRLVFTWKQHLGSKTISLTPALATVQVSSKKFVDRVAKYYYFFLMDQGFRKVLNKWKRSERKGKKKVKYIVSVWL